MGIETLIGGGIGLLGAISGRKDAKKQAQAVTDANQAQIEANKVDPRITDMLLGTGTKQLKSGVTPTWKDTYNFGTGQMSRTQSNPESDFDSNNGLLGRYQGLLDTPQSAGTKQYGQANEAYIGSNTAQDLAAARGGAMGLLAGNTAAPQMQAASATGGKSTAATAGAAQINAPDQNGMNLSGSYNSLINGAPGANPYLTGQIGKGINQANNAFGAMQRDSTKNLLENIMPSIRSNSVLTGQYGGSRQGLAEGKALESFATEQQRAMSQVGQNNTDAAVSAQAGQYSADRDRQLAATQGLGAQQYGVAGQNAAFTQQASQSNADRAQQTSQANASLTQQNSQFNAGLLQNANQNNQQAQQGTNALNSSNTQAGMAGIGGLLSQAAGAAGNQDMYDINKASNVNGLLQPYLNKNAVPTQLAPVYNNSGSSALGGAMAGVGLAGQIGSMFKTQPSPYASAAGSGATTGLVNGMASGMGQGFNWFGN